MWHEQRREQPFCTCDRVPTHRHTVSERARLGATPHEVRMVEAIHQRSSAEALQVEVGAGAADSRPMLAAVVVQQRFCLFWMKSHQCFGNEKTLRESLAQEMVIEIITDRKVYLDNGFPVTDANSRVLRLNFRNSN